MSTKPYLTVVIPVFNREREIRRALESCLAQRDADFETIVVDDASSDRSAAIAAEYADRGVRVIRHQANRGVCPARNSGARAAFGEWIVMLDSDDELVSGALQKAQHYALAATGGIGRIGLMYRYADGRVSPFPPPSGEVLSYEGFLRWLENSELWDCLTVYRRKALAEVPLREARRMELLHHLDFARRFDTCWLPEIGLLYHVDAAQRVSKGVPTKEEARQNVHEVRMILHAHGTALQRWAPGFLEAQRRRAIVSHALAGEARAAAGDALRQLWLKPRSGLNWALVFSVFLSLALGRPALKAALRLKWWLVERRRMRKCKGPSSSA